MYDTRPTEIPDRFHDFVYIEELKNILIRMAVEMKDLDPEFSKVIDENFWDLA